MNAPSDTESENAATPRRTSRLGGIVLKLIGFAGFGLFIYLIFRTGPRQIWAAVRHLTALEIASLLGLRIVYWSIRALNWQALLKASGEHVPFPELFGARIAAAAISYLTPAGNIGGETMRVFLLNRTDRKKTLATVVVDKTIEFLAGIFTIALSVFFLVTTFTLPQSRKVAMLALTAGVFGLLLFLMAKQKRGLFTWLLDALAKVKIKVQALEKRRQEVRETDALIADFYMRRRRLFYVLFGSYIVQAGLWATEIFLTFVFIGGGRTSFLNCFVIVTLGSFYTFVPVPGSVGVYELTYVSLFALLRIDMSSGMAVILIRRVLGLVWSGIGLIPLLKRKSLQDRGTPA